MEEEWRPVVGYEGLYEVSSEGRVRSLDRIVSNNWGNGPRLLKGRLLKLHRWGRYWQAHFVINRKQRNIYVHRVVAQAFPEICGIWFDDCQIDHINTNIDDNRAVNLQVCTRDENSKNPLTIEHRYKAQSYRRKTKEEKAATKREYVNNHRERYREIWRNYNYRRRQKDN